MGDVIITGASRGIGRALALALAPASERVILLSRDTDLLFMSANAVKDAGAPAIPLPCDLADPAATHRVGRELAELISDGSTLIHNAGVWPVTLEHGAGGLEMGYIVNTISPWLLQEPMIAARRLQRIVVIGAGLMVKGQFNPARTPIGADYSRYRTYCTTKMCFAISARELASKHPEIDFVIGHPGVVRTELGAIGGFAGGVLRLMKRFAETPEACAERLVTIVRGPPAETPGVARWFDKDKWSPWPARTTNAQLTTVVCAATEQHAAAFRRT